VTGQVKQTPGSLGYMELAYAKQSRLGIALIQNAAGQFVAPTAEATTAAAEDATAALGAKTDYRVSIVNAKAAAAYPIASFTWLLVSAQQSDATKGKKIADFLRWALTDGQKEAPALDYAPLPSSLVTKLMPRIDSIAPRLP
jgi:phosphate transport system substrate-binding protein